MVSLYSTIKMMHGPINIGFNMTVEVTNSEMVSADWPVIPVGRSAL